MVHAAQLAAAEDAFTDLEYQDLADGTTIVTATIALPPGWSRPQTTVRVVVPLAYPSAQPDCFFADADLRLAGGAMPTNAGIQPLDGVPLLWFSWHVDSWLPTRDNLTSYLRFVEGRLRDVR